MRLTSPGITNYIPIYIVSYNQSAEIATVDIFGQILAHWKFNANIPDSGKCSKTIARDCLASAECPTGEYCSSPKAKIVRDTKRLADLADIKLALDNYQQKHNGAYPNLAAGSYLAGKTVSTWPSWRATLGTALAVSMPIDPINKLGACSGYATTTCWNEISKKFADPTQTLHLIYLPTAAPMSIPSTRLVLIIFAV